MISERDLVVDGIGTRVLDGGDGPVVVLLHVGDHGASAASSWEPTLEPLAERFRVVAPDWLGFGGTDKLRDLVDPLGRMIRHLDRTLQVLDVARGHLVGVSMGATLLLQALATRKLHVAPDRVALVSGGGPSPDTPARKVLAAYDGTVEAMRRNVATVFHDPRFAEDDDFVRRRHEASLVPGAWECLAVAGLRRPGAPPPSGAGPGGAGPFDTELGEVRSPVLVLAGADDPLRAPGWAEQLAARLPDGHAVVFDRCGHLPQLEHPDAFNTCLVDFLTR